jgi:hypothetical protein
MRQWFKLISCDGTWSSSLLDVPSSGVRGRFVAGLSASGEDKFDSGLLSSFLLAEILGLTSDSSGDQF